MLARTRKLPAPTGRIAVATTNDEDGPGDTATLARWLRMPELEWQHALAVLCGDDPGQTEENLARYDSKDWRAQNEDLHFVLRAFDAVWKKRRNLQVGRGAHPYEVVMKPNQILGWARETKQPIPERVWAAARKANVPAAMESDEEFAARGAGAQAVMNEYRGAIARERTIAGIHCEADARERLNDAKSRAALITEREATIPATTSNPGDANAGAVTPTVTTREPSLRRRVAPAGGGGPADLEFAPEAIARVLGQRVLTDEIKADIDRLAKERRGKLGDLKLHVVRAAVRWAWCHGLDEVIEPTWDGGIDEEFMALDGGDGEIEGGEADGYVLVWRADGETYRCARKGLGFDAAILPRVNKVLAALKSGS